MKIFDALRGGALFLRARLVPNARRVLTRAFSMWLVYTAAALQIAGNVVPYMAGVIPWWAIVAILGAAAIARIIDQGGLDADK